MKAVVSKGAAEGVNVYGRGAVVAARNASVSRVATVEKLQEATTVVGGIPITLPVARWAYVSRQPPLRPPFVIVTHVGGLTSLVRSAIAAVRTNRYSASGVAATPF